jgi:hypothetical protein
MKREQNNFNSKKLLLVDKVKNLELLLKKQEDSRLLRVQEPKML